MTAGLFHILLKLMKTDYRKWALLMTCRTAQTVAVLLLQFLLPTAGLDASMGMPSHASKNIDSSITCDYSRVNRRALNRRNIFHVVLPLPGHV